jgi:hypothetical protein
VEQEPLLLFPKNLEELCTSAPKIEEPPSGTPDELRKLFRVVA